MLVQHIFESPANDLRVQAIARRWSLLFSRWMDQHNTDTPLGELDAMDYWPNKELRDGQAINLMYIPASELGSELPSDLNIGIGWMSDGSEPHSYAHLVVDFDPSTHRMIYYVVLMTSRDPRADVDVIWRLHMTSFEHELTHYFDRRRGYDRTLARLMTMTGKPPSMKRFAAPEDYYNDSLEFNAHFQQIFSSMFLHLAAHIAQKAHFGAADEDHIAWMESFDAFWHEFQKKERYQKDEFLRFLTPMNKRKLIRRLYKLYSLLTQADWQNIEEIKQHANDLLQNWRAQDEKYGRTNADIASEPAEAVS